MKKIAVLGGTFDPVHRGHVSLAADAIKQAEIDKVLFMPAKLQPFKLDKDVSAEEHRLTMLRLALEGMDKMDVTRVELEADDISYTYISLEKLRRSEGVDKIYLITGTDTFLKLEIWMKSDILLRDNGFVVGVRPGYREEELKAKKELYERHYGTEVIVIDNERLDISSTEIREKACRGEDVKNLTSPKVADYIRRNKLYE